MTAPAVLVRDVRKALRAVADPERAVAMAAYMKTDMPFYGVGKPQRVGIFRSIVRPFPVASRKDYEAAVKALWARPHREEKYLAIQLARHHDEYVTLSSVPLYQFLIRDGAWWDFVDEVAVHLLGRVLLRQRDALQPRLATWLDHRSLWIRRSVIISQVAHKDATDAAFLFAACEHCMHEKDFFLRKAIGWALRQYAYIDPAAVRAFLRKHGDRLSPLSVREAAKHLGAR